MSSVQNAAAADVEVVGIFVDVVSSLRPFSAHALRWARREVSPAAS